MVPYLHTYIENAELFFAMVALIAVLAAINHTANGNMCANGKLLHIIPDSKHTPYDFMPWDQWVLLRPPIPIDCVQIRMANTAI
jgi:hypothetical protein